jgi:membrane-bound inhibitor of C-type lysozyme
MRSFLASILLFMLQGCAPIATLLSCAVDQPTEKPPLVTDARFSVLVELEQEEGRRKVLSRTFTCRYEGRKCDGRGTYNEWTRSFGNDRDTPLLTTLKDGTPVHLSVASCSTLMSGTKYDSAHYAWVKQRRGSLEVVRYLSNDQLQELAETKVISYAVSELP